jgi:nucleoside-diphosphate-sugar epimerase
MKVLITGGTGFVGFWMQRTQPPNIDATYLNRKQYYDCLWAAKKWDAIVHLALVSPSYVLQKAPRVLFASSGAVYEGRTEYADNKRKWEKLCLDSDVVIARLFTFVGERLKNLYAITNFIDDALHGRPITVCGNGNTVRSYLYGEDLGHWMWGLLFGLSGTYDVGSYVPYTTLEVARLVADIIPAKIEVLNAPGVPTTRYLPNITYSEWEKVGLREAIERTINARYYVLHASL